MHQFLGSGQCVESLAQSFMDGNAVVHHAITYPIGMTQNDSVSHIRCA